MDSCKRWRWLLLLLLLNRRKTNANTKVVINSIEEITKYIEETQNFFQAKTQLSLVHKTSTDCILTIPLEIVSKRMKNESVFFCCFIRSFIHSFIHSFTLHLPLHLPLHPFSLIAHLQVLRLGLCLLGKGETCYFLPRDSLRWWELHCLPPLFFDPTSSRRSFLRPSDPRSKSQQQASQEPRSHQWNVGRRYHVYLKSLYPS